ncbi:sugar-binding protein [Streptomyces sp. NPDC088928]|uniref:sugar-binding protein n=1 Tax=Streptomyces sp. NPDC088928 TaxID=3365915 RepID=UPI00381CA05E
MGRPRRSAAWGGAAALLGCLLVVAPLPGTAPAAHAAGALTVTSPDLIFVKGQAKITLASDEASVAWKAVDDQGLTVASGTVPVSGGTATVDVTALGSGYYTLTATAGATTRTANFGVLTALTGKEQQDTRFGTGIHYGWNDGDDQKLLRSVKLMGMHGVRSDINWGAIEKTPGAYSWSSYSTDQHIPYAKSQGLTALPISGYRNPNYDGNRTPASDAALEAYGKFTAAAVEKYQQSSKEIEIYNEYNSTGFNNGTCGITADCYLKLLQASYGKVHAKVPDATVVGGGLAGLQTDWLKRLYAIGGLKYLDALSVHQYGYPSPPETALSTLPQVRADLDAAGGKDVPLWITENGYPTHSDGVTPAEQATYVPRAQIFSFASGVSRYYWYDLTNDGTDATNKEHNFGAFKRPTAEVKAWQPKPSVVTESVLIRQLAGRAYAGRDDAGSADVRSYRFGTGSNTVRALYTTAATPGTAELSASGPVTVTDQLGHEKTYLPVGGKVQLGIDGKVLYVKGAVNAVKTVSGPVFSLRLPQHSNTEETVDAVLQVDGTKDRTPLPLRYDFKIAGEKYRVTARPGKVVRRTVQLPTSALTGPRTVSGTVGLGPLNLARLTSDTEVVEPTRVTFDPVVKKAAPFAAALKVTVTNNRVRGPLELTKLDWQVNEGTAYLDRGTIDGPIKVGPGASASYTVDARNIKQWKRYWTAAYVNTPDGARTAVGVWNGWGAVQPADTDTTTPIDVIGDGSVKYTGGYNGAADLSGTVRPQYDDAGLVLKGAITDNVLAQPATTAENMWQGDSIQFAVTPQVPGRSKQYVEFGASLVGGKPQVYTWRAPSGQSAGPTPGATARITRDGTTTHYTVTVPWASLGLTGKPTESIGLGFVVNDSDNDGRARGWSEWGASIANNSKSAAGLRAVQLTD